MFIYIIDHTYMDVAGWLKFYNNKTKKHALNPQYCIVLQCKVMQCNTLQYKAMYIMQCNALQCTVN